MSFSTVRKIQSILPFIACLLLSALAFFTPIWPGQSYEEHLGALLFWCGILEIYHSFRRAFQEERNSGRYSGAYSFLMALILLNADLLVHKAVLSFVVAVFAFDAARYFYKFFKEKKANASGKLLDLLSGAGNILVIMAIFLLKEKGIAWSLSIAIGLRIVGVAFSILAAKTGLLDQVSEDIIRESGWGDNKEIKELADRIEKEEAAHAYKDRHWILVFVFLLFFIHLGRMGFDRSFLGILSPLIAIIGDMFIALVITFAIMAPIRYAFRRVSGLANNSFWAYIQKVEPSQRKGFGLRFWLQNWMTWRLRVAIRFRKAGYSMKNAIRTGLGLGLPYAALLAAVMPVLGMSWYFDTENWASGIWDRWAATRADTWRMAMTEVSGEGTTANSFNIQPVGVTDSSDFSFVVIGDPGEGDASQLILKDQIVSVTNQPDVKFMVISSDVVYPSGTLKDYEKKFWLPFKGVTKPVLAIPGNHDWYDALEGFNATFLDSAAARKAIQARINKDLNISSTTDDRITEMLGKVAEWKKEYGVPTGFQKAPYFQISTKDFVFISIETGVERQIDSLQLKWVKEVLDSSKGKFVMALLGHPFYAIGEYQGSMNPAFEELHQLLRKYKVPLVMAGDTHDLEYYKETDSAGSDYVMHHFVNGGGGAYLSIGAAMAKEGTMPVKEYAFYPSHDPLVKKIEANTTWYKYPAWWWTKKMNSWPFSAEWLSGMFDYNVSPFFQSFMEIKVERSKHRIRLIPYSNHGRLKWADLTSTTGSRPTGATATDLAEWTIPMQ